MTVAPQHVTLCYFQMPSCSPCVRISWWQWQVKWSSETCLCFLYFECNSVMSEGFNWSVKSLVWTEGCYLFIIPSLPTRWFGFCNKIHWTVSSNIVVNEAKLDLSMKILHWIPALSFILPGQLAACQSNTIGVIKEIWKQLSEMEAPLSSSWICLLDNAALLKCPDTYYVTFISCFSGLENGPFF